MSEALFEVGPSLGKFPAKQICDTTHMTAALQRGHVAAGLAELQQHRGDLPRSVQIRLDAVIKVLAPQGQQEVARAFRRRCQLLRTSVSFAGLRRTPALECAQRLAERDLQIELALAAPTAVGESRNQRQPAAEQCHGFREHRASPGLPAGGEPIVNRLLRQPGFLAMVREQCRLG